MGTRIKLQVSKIPDLARAMQIMARAARCENILFTAQRGMEIFISELNRKSLLYLHCHPDFFEQYQVQAEPIEVGMHLNEFATALHEAYHVSHLKLIDIQDTVEGQLQLAGTNPNGICVDHKISPQPFDTPYVFDFARVPLQYPFCLDVPSKLFHTELATHQNAKMLTLTFDAERRGLIFRSTKQHGLISECKKTFLLHPENIILPPHSSSARCLLQSQTVHIDTKYLRIMARLYKLSHVIRIYMCTNQPVVFEYILKQSPRNPAENSSIHLRIGRTTCERHPYVDP